MSADNYYVIRKHPFGGYAAVQGFASDEETPEATEKHQQFETLSDAILWTEGEYIEYGVSVHPECNKPTTNKILHMPTTENIRDAYISGDWNDNPADDEAMKRHFAAEFDRWLAAFAQEQYESGRKDAGDAVKTRIDAMPENIDNVDWLMIWALEFAARGGEQNAQS